VRSTHHGAHMVVWMLAAIAGALLAVAAGAVSGARAAQDASWRLAPAQPPPPPAGVAPAPYPVPLGEIGELSFWAPDRGLLVTGGAGPVEAGVYAYDGNDWRQLASVCGGNRGRIAWAGPDEFWTIAAQRPGQLLPPGAGILELSSLSLCHFVGGQVVASYAMPLGRPDSYLPMDAAACYGPSDCWFAGQDSSSSEGGAFHLHWNGSTLAVADEPYDHAVTDMVDFAGELYESVQIKPGDTFLPSESTTHPALIHTIAPEGILPTFDEAFIISSGKVLPDLGKEILPGALQGASLGTDGLASGVGATQLWAAANPVNSSFQPAGSQPAPLTVLRYDGQKWSQVLPLGEGVPAGETLPPGETLSGARSLQVGGENEEGTSEAIAPEPGSDRAWLSLRGEGLAGAEVALLEPDGDLAEPPQLLPSAEEPEPVGARGGAGPITCPAPHDCWMATTAGWLFHLTDGTAPSGDAASDPLFNGEDGVIDYRPPDAGVPVIYPDLPPVDDSLANQQSAIAPPASEAPPPRAGRHKKAKALVKRVHSSFLHHRTLVLAFTLTASAHVQLIARRHGHVVARTPRRTLHPGPHRLSLSFDPSHWPTKLQFEATPVGGAQGAGTDGSESSNTVSTG
jgi:hypothetical protein